jgi:rSAM/selenodomain-associated transferase 1
MAKAPQAGQVKTRLQPLLNPKQAADVAGILLSESVRRLRGAWTGSVELWGWPDVEHRLIQRLASRYDIALFNQVPGDLGQKMQAALDSGLADGVASAVVGADIPHVELSLVRRAERLLNRGQAVYGPSGDGGFWLLGLTRSVAGLFAGIPWSSNETGALTLARAKSLGISFDIFNQVVNDIDSIEDLQLALRQDRLLHEKIFVAMPELKQLLCAPRYGVRTGDEAAPEN